MKKWMLTIMLIFCFFPLTVHPASADLDEARMVVEKYTFYMNQHEWSKIPTLWVNETKEEITSFLSSKENLENKSGFFNVKSVRIEQMKELPFEEGSKFVDEKSLSSFSDVKFFYIKEHVKVYKENDHIVSGTNFNIVVVVKEENKWKIAYHLNASTNTLISDGFGFGGDDEKKFEEKVQSL